MFKILVVEDDIALNDSIKIFLTKKGYNVFCSYSAKYALQELEKFPVDLIEHLPTDGIFELMVR